MFQRMNDLSRRLHRWELKPNKMWWKFSAVVAFFPQEVGFMSFHYSVTMASLYEQDAACWRRRHFMFISDYYDDGSVQVSKEELSKYPPAQRQTHPSPRGLSPVLPSVCRVWWVYHKKIKWRPAWNYCPQVRVRIVRKVIKLIPGSW